MRIHPLVPFALAVASAAVPACADSAPLRANRRLQESLTPETDEEIVEAKKDSTPTVITSNTQLDGNMRGGKLKEVKVVGLVLTPGEEAGKYLKILFFSICLPKYISQYFAAISSPTKRSSPRACTPW